MLLAMMEAASCGCSVITTNSCSMPEFIKDRVNGILVESQDPKSIAKAINLLVFSEEVRDKFKEKMRKNLTMYWDESIRTKELYSAYKRIMDGENA